MTVTFSDYVLSNGALIG